MNKFTNSQIHKSMAFVIEIRIQTSKSPISNEKSTKIGNDISIFNLNEQKKTITIAFNAKQKTKTETKMR